MSIPTSSYIACFVSVFLISLLFFFAKKTVVSVYRGMISCCKKIYKKRGGGVETKGKRHTNIFIDEVANFLLILLSGIAILLCCYIFLDFSTRLLFIVVSLLLVRLAYGVSKHRFVVSFYGFIEKLVSVCLYPVAYVFIVLILSPFAKVHNFLKTGINKQIMKIKSKRVNKITFKPNIRT